MPAGDFRGLAQREYLYNNSPTATLFENFPHDYITTDCVIGTTGLITAVAVPLIQGSTITKISFIVGATAGATLTNQYVCLYSGATVPLVLAQSTAGAAAAMAANTAFTGTLATPFVVPSSGIYYAGICVTGTTIPTLVGKVTMLNATAAAAIYALATLALPPVAVTATGNATVAPATLAGLTNLAVQPYVMLQ